LSIRLILWRLLSISAIKPSGPFTNCSPDKIKGVLLGLLAGDRIGGPTKMASLLADSLLESQCFRADDVLMRYYSWWKNEGFDTGVVCQKLFEYMDAGVQHKAALKLVDTELNGKTAGCNPVHRSLPLALCPFVTEFQLESVANQEAAITHKHRDPGIVSAAALRLVRFLVSGQEWQQAINHLENISSSFMSNLLINGRKGLIEDTGLAKDVFSAAIYFIDSSNDFDQMMERSLAFSPESNYCPVLAGGIGGARWGMDAISPYWYKTSPLENKMQALAQDISHLWP
jgi:ADP-ribosylglycohydrolase